MKKSIALFIIVTMMFSLALAGCSQNTDTPVVNDSSTTNQNTTASNDNSSDDFDTGDSTIMDGTNNPDGKEEPELGNDETIPDDAAEETAQGSNSALETSINVMDYIDGEYWRMSKMMIDLGYNPAEAYGNTNFKDYRNDTSPQIRIGFSVSGGKIISVDIEPLDYSFDPIHIFADNESEGYIAKTLEFEIHLDTIKAIAYACEQFNLNQSTDPFEGVLRYENGVYWAR